MENSNQIIENLYGVTGHGKATTEILKTKGGNYIYRHVISGNSRCDARVYNPVTGEDRFLDNPGYFHHLVNHVKVDCVYTDSAVIGADVANTYERICGSRK